MNFRLLGSVEVCDGGRRLAIGHAKQRAVLAVLLMEAGKAVSTATLIDRVWSHDPPNGALNVLYAYVARLRKVLAPAGVQLRSRSNGYALEIEPDSVDVHRFLALAGRAASAGSPQERAETLDEALAQWHGEAFADTDSGWLAEQRAALAARRHSALLDRNEAYLSCGRHAELVDELADLVSAHPMDERVLGQLMLALYRCGRTAEALDQYRSMRRRLVEEQGTQPGPQLRELHQRMLRGDEALVRPGIREGDALPTPAGLPHDVEGFVGRGLELARLDALVPRANSGRTVVISAVDGTAGVGKTALAIHWAHRVKHLFPDGNLYANLHGFGPGAPAGPDQVLDAFLAALDVAPAKIPSDVDSKAALYRSLLDERAMLIVLDNAATSQQIRPLLPGSPSCMVIVTSRNRLTGLAARDRAQRVTLDVLPVGEAVALLTQFVGEARAAAEPEAVTDLARLCACLPIALCVAGERAAASADLDLEKLVAQLRAAGSRLDLLDAEDDPETAVRAVFSWSYDALPDPAARLFRLVGLHPGPEFSVAAAASLAGSPAPDVGLLLDLLAQANLIATAGSGRYHMHDLLRVYASDLAHRDDSADRRGAAIDRVLDHYLHTAHAAALLIEPAREPLPLEPPAAGAVPESLGSYDQALAWLTIEHPTLFGMVGLAESTGHDAHTWQMAWALRTFQLRASHLRDFAAVQRAGLAAAHRLGDLAMEAQGHRCLAAAFMWRNRFGEAREHLSNALDVYRHTDDRAGEAHAYLSLAYVESREGNYAVALAHAQHALEVNRAARDPFVQARAHNNCGWMHAQLGQLEQALDHCERAVTLFQELGDGDGEAAAWDSLGNTQHRLGKHDDAIDCYQRAIQLYRGMEIRYSEAYVLGDLAETYRAAGSLDEARDALREALSILTDINHPDAEQVGARLRELDLGRVDDS